MKELIDSVNKIARGLRKQAWNSEAATLDAAADELEKLRWRRFGDEKPSQGAVVHVFRADGHAIVHFHADDVNQWHLEQALFEAQPDDMWRPANLPTNG